MLQSMFLQSIVVIHELRSGEPDPITEARVARTGLLDGDRTDTVERTNYTITIDGRQVAGGAWRGLLSQWSH